MSFENHVVEAMTEALLGATEREQLQPYFEAADDGRLVIQACNSCAEHYYYPRMFCPHCASRDVRWVETSGKGEVYSYSHLSRVQPAPYILAYVTLAEGPTVLSRVVADQPDEVRIGQAVTAAFGLGPDGKQTLFFR